MSVTLYALLLVLGAIWGASFLMIKVAGQAFAPLTLAFLRVLIGSVCLRLMLHGRGIEPPRGPLARRRFAVVGLFSIFIPFALISWGTMRIPSGSSAILNGTMPLFTAIVAHLVGEARLTWRSAAGVLVGFVGVVVLALPNLRGGMLEGLWGQLAVLVAAMSYGVGIVYARRKVNQWPPLAAAYGQVAYGCAWLLPFALLEKPWQATPTLPAVVSLVILGAVGTAIAYAIYYELLAKGGATFTAMVTYIVPPFGLVWGWAILQETLTWYTLLTLALIVVGLLLARSPRKSHSAAPAPEGVISHAESGAE